VGGREDAYGRLILDALDGKEPIEVVERDDGFVFAYRTNYLVDPYRRWQPVERRAMRFVRGRALDIGCGAGRVCLHLQERGAEVVGIDNSPGAVEACRRRGVKDVRLVSIRDIDEELGTFDTLLMVGNNFGLLGARRAAVGALRRLHAVTRPGGRLIGQSFDPHSLTDPAQMAYRARNVERGRLPGTQRVRVRYLDRSTPWFDVTMFSPAELEALLDGTGWRARRILPGRGAGYVAIIDRVDRS
jgi:SAM-dependent methyltransferase